MTPVNKLKLGLIAVSLAANHAWAQQGSATLYGLIDGGVAYQQITGPGQYSQTRLGFASGMQTTSRWGMRGQEPLGNGFSANFQLESSIDISNGSLLSNGRLFGLQSWVGLSKDDAGYFRLGRQSGYAPEFFLAIDPFRGGLGQARMAYAFGAANSNTKYSNMIKLMLEPTSGLKVGAGYSFSPQMNTFYFDGVKSIAAGSDYNESTMNNTRLITLGVSYNKGPLMLAASYDQVMPNGADPRLPSNIANSANIQEWIVGGKYDFGAIQLSAAVGQNKGGAINIQGVSFTTVGKPTLDINSWGGGQGAIIFDPNMNFNSYMLGFTLPLSGVSKIFSSWTRAANNGTTNAQNNVGAQDAYSIGYQYDFTPRTNMYMATSYATNPGFIAGTTSFYLVTGLRHRF
ncbi:MAG: porin [Alcaligenaceae bacterium]